VRVAVAKALGRLGYVKETSAILLAAAQDRQIRSWTREVAADTLDELGHVEAAIQAWLALAQDEQVEGRARLRAGNVLGRLGRIDKAASVLLELVHNYRLESWVRGDAAKSLSKLGRTEEATQAWLVLMKAGETTSYGAQALAELGRVQDLLAVARDERLAVSVRVAAIGALERFGDASLLPDLERLAREDTSKTLWGKRVTDAAHQAIARIRARMAQTDQQGDEP